MNAIITTEEGQQVVLADLTPPGAISGFGGAAVPSGWLLCDGSAVSRTTYASLFAIIGVAYGYGDQSTTFNVPDFRGQFLRGVDGSAGVDPDKTTRVALKPGGNTGNNVGSQEPCHTKTPLSSFSIPTSTYGTGADSPAHTHQYSVGFASNGASTSQNSPNAGGSDQTGGASTRHNHPILALSINGGDPETRPTNVYVNYLIKT
jgi:microcystin-dependent protein